ncbi:MAG: LysR family transcriptional regulator [Balneolales bacterium]|nr:LysR family transcriptional regulator [Balneolales bacterium]
MTLTQLRYALAIEEHGNFAKAAAACFITQPTLSMQIKKLEEDIGCVIFDRSLKPIGPTPTGRAILEQTREIIRHAELIPDIIQAKEEDVSGELHLGIIPTLAPYLLPLFMPQFLRTFPGVTLHISELDTDHIITQLKNNELDIGLLVTPLDEPAIDERPLFYEQLFAYVSTTNRCFKLDTIAVSEIDFENLLLLEEGHCMRSQVINICEKRNINKPARRLRYESGSIDTLMRVVENHNAITIFPELALTTLSEKQLNLVRSFRDPVPLREVSLATHHSFMRKRIAGALHESILNSIPLIIKNRPKEYVIPV